MSRPHKRDKVAVVNPNTDETVIVSRANANDLVNLNGWSYASAKPAEQSVEDAEPTDTTDTDENEPETVPSPVAEETVTPDTTDTDENEQETVPSPVAEETVTPDADEEGEIEALRARAAELGIEFDGRWREKKLKEAIAEAEAEAEAE